MYNVEDHGLPLVQLRELRRELVLALVGGSNSISQAHIEQISSLHYAIAAIEAVIIDLDAEQGVIVSPTLASRISLAA